MKEGKRLTTFTLIHNSESLEIESLSVESGKGNFQIYWNEVISASAFKLDLMAVDCICMALELTKKRKFELNEEMKGWDSLVEALPTYLPGFKKSEEWFSGVAFSAFETNLTPLYIKEQNQSELDNT
ncbi:MAG: hypothetical protein ACSHYA_00565 [Opitutaceae bacterium]